MIKSVLTFFTLLVGIGYSYSASFKDTTEATGFATADLEKIIVWEINKMRAADGLDSLELNEVLTCASQHQAEHMSHDGKVEVTQHFKKYKTTGLRVKSCGGTQKAEEVVFGTPMSKGKDEYNTKAVADVILAKWKVGKKERPIIMSPHYIFAGVSAVLDPERKKVYVSVTFGSYNTFNTGADKRKLMKVPYTKKVKKIKPPVNEAKECKNCLKFKDYQKLVEGLYVENGKIYLRYDDIKALKKILKSSKDGFGVDVVQRLQYENPEYTILDNNLVTKGIFKKALYKDAIYKKNRVHGEGKKQPAGLDVCIGKLPAKLEGEYELNLLIIQNNKVCKSITKSYIENTDQESNTPLDLLLMPDSDAYLKPQFKPVAENTILTFNIPFEKNKSDYKEEDIKPLLDAMQEPDYLMEGLYIYAYSSIEGDSAANAKLQQKRAESIIASFKAMNKGIDLSTSIKTSDSWDLFRLEMEDGRYAELTEMKKNDAIKKINGNKELLTELEPYFAKERFARVIMDITYDIKGDKEQKYSAATFNKALKKSDVKQALKIQYFIEKQIREGKYNIGVLEKMEIPPDARNSGFLNNRIVYKYHRNQKKLDEDDLKNFDELVKLDPSNSYVAFNSCFTHVKLGDAGDRKQQDEMQNKIDALYKTSLPKKAIDALNIEFQFKLIDANDTLDNSEAIIEQCVNRIKSFYNFKEGSWQNALKLSYVFARFKDYKFATQILEPYIIGKFNIDENLLYTYISFCAQMPDKIKSKGFVYAMKMASETNKERYCRLFGQPYLTFQVLDNTDVKEDYIKTACPAKEN